MMKEKFTYAIVSFFFALSYVFRFYANIFVYCNDSNPDAFIDEMFSVSIYLIEGTSMGVLMIYHLINFEGGTLMAETRTIAHSSGSIVHESLF